MDGENLRYGSSGTRLLLTLLGILFDERFSVLLIDEPEIGLSPRIQAIISRFLYDPKLRQEFCPHLRQVYISTHSHLFLDRNVLSNNYIVTKVRNAVSIKAVESVADYHQLQFNLLGNELEAISFPSAIVLVEGASDTTFLNKVVQLHLPNRKVSVVGVNGEGEMLDKLNFFKQAFGDISNSPYRDRLFVMLDKKYSVRIPRIERQGVHRENIVLLSKNGIEYFYPIDIVTSIFRCNSDEIGNIKFENDPIKYQEIWKTKKQLSHCVADALTKRHKLHTEIEDLIKLISKTCN